MAGRLAILSSHPIQYYAPLFRQLASGLDLTVYFAHRATPLDQARAGFGTAFDWDVDLLDGFKSEYLNNVARRPGLHHFSGCDTPEIGRKLRDGRFDALLLMGWHLKTYLQGLVAAKRLGLRVLVRGDSQLATPRGAVRRVLKELAYPHFLRCFDAALYVGERSRAYYRHYSYPEQRLVFSPHAVDTAWFAARATAQARASVRARLGIAPDATVLLFAGKLLPFKRPGDLIHAAAALRHSGREVEVMIAGDGELREHLEAEAGRMRVPLRLLGFCNQSEMPGAYAAADCLVLPSDARETWGLVANEALACGRPVVVSDACGCAPDLAVGSRAGRRFPVGNIAALADAIDEVFVSPPTALDFRSIEATFGLGRAVEGIQSAFHQVSHPGHVQ